MSTLKERLLAKTNITNDCWEFEGACDSWGYGVIYYKGKYIGAHRAAWICEHGDIEEGVHILHTCDNPPCINLEHLFDGTHRDNMNDRDRKGRQHSGMTRLSDVEVVEIRRLLRDTKRTLEDIGNQFNMSRHAIFDIKRGRTWTHVE